jgi:hypothetical protein
MVEVLLLLGGLVMVVPDAAVYAALPLMGGALVWGGRQFVLSVMGKKIDNEAPTDEISIRTYRKLCDMFKLELNGRYMAADEARSRFEEIERKSRERFERIEERLADIYGLMTRFKV